MTDKPRIETPLDAVDCLDKLTHLQQLVTLASDQLGYGADYDQAAKVDLLIEVYEIAAMPLLQALSAYLRQQARRDPG